MIMETLKMKQTSTAPSRNIIASIDRKYGRCGGPWMVGERLTYVDFVVYEFIDQASQNFNYVTNISKCLKI